MLLNICTLHRTATTNENFPCSVSVEVDFGNVLVPLSPVLICCISTHCTDSFSVAIFPKAQASPLSTSAPLVLALALAPVLLLPCCPLLGAQLLCRFHFSEKGGKISTDWISFLFLKC